ncbi:MAG: OmpH family outer membrane protein [Syntrophobacterales bacterium]|nr:MAG: OmpH family outer membrane protein [Syntrophobacterales bacterium]
MNKNVTKRNVIILCGALIFSVFGVPAHASEIKIGYIDIARVLNESEPGKEAKVVMEGEYQKFQNEIAQRQRELKALQETLQKQELMLSEKARKEKEREYQNKLKESKRWAEDRQGELKQKEIELTKAALKDLEATLKKLGEEEKFTLILAKNETILYISSAIDLTNRVIQILNSSSEK